MAKKSAFIAFNTGNLTANEFAVLTVARAGSNNGILDASTSDISESLNGELSRHAVARALRNLQSNKWLTWKTNVDGVRSRIVVD